MGGSLNAWLRQAADRAKKGGDLRVVLGNEASDLDSMASALTYAFFLARGGGSRAVTLPVLNIPRADLPLRTEAAWLFREAGVDPDALIFLDEIDLEAVHAEGRLRLVLVDHNRLASAQSGWAAAVEEILDHHADEGLYAGARRVIAPVGSCATLVAEQLFESTPQLADLPVGKLLLGPILLDTVNLDPAAKKVTPRDEAAVERLLAVTGADRRVLFERLQAEKLKVAALSTRDILRRDCKEFQAGGLHCGISSVPLPLQDWARQDPGLEASFRAYAGEHGLGLLVILSAYTRPDFRRELAVYAEDRILREDVIAFLNRSGLGLTPLETGIPAGNAVWLTQADLGGSRKKVLPLVAAFLRERR